MFKIIHTYRLFFFLIFFFLLFLLSDSSEGGGGGGGGGGREKERGERERESDSVCLASHSPLDYCLNITIVLP